MIENPPPPWKFLSGGLAFSHNALVFYLRLLCVFICVCVSAFSCLPASAVAWNAAAGDIRSCCTHSHTQGASGSCALGRGNNLIYWGIPRHIDQNSVKLTPPHFLFWWKSVYRVIRCPEVDFDLPRPLRSTVSELMPRAFSRGHVKQDNLWRSIALRPMHIINQKCISTWSQWVKEHFCDLHLKNLMTSYIFLFSAYTPFPKKCFFFYCILKFEHLSCDKKKIGGVFFRKIFLIISYKPVAAPAPRQ